MKILHGGGFQKSERMGFVLEVHKNIITAIQAVIDTLDESTIQLKPEILAV